jgi:hypothetical protein
METPKYGGNLEISTVYATLSALSFDSYDWPWKHNHDTGSVYEQLFATDLSKAKSRGGEKGFVADAYIPSELIRGELAEKWEWLQNPLRVKITLRKGVMFPEKEGVMKARELVAEDVVFSYKRLASSPKAIPTYFDYIKDVTAPDKYTVIFEMKHHFAEWDYRFGYGYYSAIMPKEVVDAGATDWKNVNGTGPFKLTNYIQGNSNTYEKNPNYWDKETINEKEFKLPYVDKITYRIIKDEATRVTALRTGKIDIMESIRWQDAEQLKKSAPDLKWNRWLATSGTFLSMRVDQKPFDDIRVRRALNMAVNKEEIIKAYYNGNAEMFAYPQHPEYTGERAGAVQVRSGQGEEAACRSRLSERIHVQDPGLLVQRRSHGSDSAGGGLSRAGRRETGDPADGVRRLPVGDDDADERARLFHEQRPHQPNDDDPQELRKQADLEPVELRRSGVRCEDGRRLSGTRREQAQGRASRVDDRNTRQGALCLDADAVCLHGVVAVGEGLCRRAARRRRASRTGLRPHLDRPGSEEEDGLLSASGRRRDGAAG